MGPAADPYLTPHTTHFTICHEVGHLLGLEHPYGLLSEDLSGPQERGYGSPHCVVGTAPARSGARSRCGPRPCPAADRDPVPPQTAALWSNSGPRLAMAERFARGLRRLRLAHTAVVPPLLPGGIAVHPGLPAAGCSVAEVADHAGPADTPRAVACRVGAGWLVVELRLPAAGCSAWPRGTVTPTRPAGWWSTTSDPCSATT